MFASGVIPLGRQRKLKTAAHVHLEDAETGEVVAGPVVTEQSRASLTVRGPMPSVVRAVVSAEDDEGESDSASLDVVPVGNGGTCRRIRRLCSATPFGISIAMGMPMAIPS